MKIDEIRKFENKKVILTLKNSFSYHGVILKISESSIEFQDRYTGIMNIDPDFIAFITGDQHA